MDDFISDGNSGTNELVFIKDGLIIVSDDLEPEYGSSRYECHLYHVASVLKDMAQRYYDENQLLKAENSRLAGRAQKPRLKPSIIASTDKVYKVAKKKRTVIKNPKKSDLEITDSHVIKIDGLPESSVFKGYKNYYVQEIEVKVHNHCYRRERWQLPSGEYRLGELPASIRGNHFGPSLREFILYQYYHNHVAQPLLLNQLRELGISISSGQLSNLLTKKKQAWHAEKESLLSTAIQISDYIQVDDTGARHQGKNGYCTQLGNENFAYFKTSQSKSKSNFLSILQTRHSGYKLNQAAFEYLCTKKQFSNFDRDRIEIELKLNNQIAFSSENELVNYLRCGSFNQTSDKLLLEAAMIGHLSEAVFPPKLVILSDEAKQFDLGRNAACWVHAERKLTKILPKNERQISQKDKKLKQFWKLYRTLKKCINGNPLSYQRKYQLRKRFENLCQPVEKFKVINNELSHLLNMKNEMLKCLEQPHVPLHNNMSESDIREYVKRRKISGCTKSDDGRDAIDTFLSLKKTCQRHQISFLAFLKDRIQNLSKIHDLTYFINKTE
jgi:hypothetical protein